MKKIIKRIDKILYLFYRKKHMLIGFSFGWLAFVIFAYDDMSLKILINLFIILLVLAFYCVLDICYIGGKKNG